jgi:hypothetical protein
MNWIDSLLTFALCLPDERANHYLLPRQQRENKTELDRLEHRHSVSVRERSETSAIFIPNRPIQLSLFSSITSTLARPKKTTSLS